MNELFLSIVNMSISASLLVLAVLILRFLLKKCPKWVNVLLWGIVALRLICPITPESGLSLVPPSVSSGALLSEWTDDYTQDNQIIHGNSPDFQAAVSGGAHIVDAGEEGYYAVAGADGISPPATVENQVVPILAVLWAAGLLVLLTYTVVSYWKLRRKVREATLLRENIYQCECVGSPFVLGMVRPRIYLPYRIGEQDLNHVVAHEQAHLHRKDHWWKPLGFLLLAVYWFNPLMWLAYVLLCRDIELACDEKVIKQLGSEQRADYTQALLSCSVNRRLIAACPLAFGEVGVKARVKSVMNYKKPAFWVIVVALLACAVLALCFLTDPSYEKSLLPLSPYRYEVVEVTYESPGSDFSMVAQHNTPSYSIRDGMQLASYDEYAHGNWVLLGTLSEVDLNRENFDRLFFGSDGAGWRSGKSAASIRKHTARAWKLVYDQSHLYYVLQQKNGDLYLARGYYDFSEQGDPYSDDTNIRWLFKLVMKEKQTEPELFQWFDHTQDRQEGQDHTSRLNHYAFRGVTFHYTNDQIIASKDGVDRVLISGMPIWNAYLTDLTGDGLPEICASLSMGSGMIDNRIIIYDYANDVSYELQDRGHFNYTLRFSVDDGALYVDQSEYAPSNLLRSESHVIASGRLAYIDGCIEILYPDDTHSVAPMENTVTEIGRGSLQSPVPLSNGDAERLRSLLERGDWNAGETTDCAPDCAINLNGILVYYHSECGTMVAYDYSKLSTLSSREPSEACYAWWALPEADRIFVNNLLLQYISLTGGITDIAQPKLTMATLKDLVMRKGEDLTWEDFSPYWSESVGSGLHILRYPMDGGYYLLIGGTSVRLPPMYLRLVNEADQDRYIDVRYEDLYTFLASAPLITVRSGGAQVAPYVHLRWARQWSEDGWLAADGTDLMANLPQIQHELPQIEFGSDFSISCRNGVTLGGFTIYNDMFEPVHSSTRLFTGEFSNAPIDKLLSELELGTYDLVLNVLVQGNYVEAEDTYETAAYHCVYQLVKAGM